MREVTGDRGQVTGKPGRRCFYLDDEEARAVELVRLLKVESAREKVYRIDHVLANLSERFPMSAERLQARLNLTAAAVPTFHGSELLELLRQAEKDGRAKYIYGRGWIKT